jgi:hypothetical protein
MALIFHQLFPGGKVIEALAKRPGGLAANLTSKNFRDLRDAIAEAYKSGPVFEALTCFPLRNCRLSSKAKVFNSCVP